MRNIIIDDLAFELLFDHEQIQKRVRLIGIDINIKYADKNPVFLGVLNGSFMFLADLMKQIHIPCEISFVKLASYQGTQQENVRELLGAGMSLEGRHVVIVEDIVDTGRSLLHIMGALEREQVASASVATLLLKPDCLRYSVDSLMYVGFEIDREFVVGYGLDYNGQCRNLRDIYKNIPS
ncbi:MAG: phosphoribosyltransferase [Sphingobacterium sp.]